MAHHIFAGDPARSAAALNQKGPGQTDAGGTGDSTTWRAIEGTDGVNAVTRLGQLQDWWARDRPSRAVLTEVAGTPDVSLQEPSAAQISALLDSLIDVSAQQINGLATIPDVLAAKQAVVTVIESLQSELRYLKLRVS